jgi:hypothetical protein
MRNMHNAEGKYAKSDGAWVNLLLALLLSIFFGLIVYFR